MASLCHNWSDISKTGLSVWDYANFTFVHSFPEVHGHSRGSSRITCVSSLSVAVWWVIYTIMPSNGVAVASVAQIVRDDGRTITV